eukprot:CAMPEP_0202701990 /NCGR_PEP_ID=MMETSP1385-20130828/15036_1 /ASSEMBLY_ACC=CAM_ASM_000861 /TAXON_ID=933848 /ORGANISM="Elphidium margaritaceum" /LENGTH=120 /DNA_ID=CAMNT_0049359537 /DNA_START=273 /DNA_END=632 /DNA_ORIENTATION=+
MDEWLEYALNITMDKKAACGNGTVSNCVDKSVEISYDASYGYITEIVIDRAAMSYDGGFSFTFACFDAYVSSGVKTNASNPRSCDYSAIFTTSASPDTSTSESDTNVNPTSRSQAYMPMP